MKKLTKRSKKIAELFDFEKSYSLDEALEILQQYAKTCKAKFDETVELIMALGVDPRQNDQMVRGMVPLPHGSGKTVKVAVFVKDEKIAEAKAAGADIVGAEDLIEEVKNGRMDFDICIASPDMMPKMAILGKILGPSGLMPNPKLGTVTQDIPAAIAQAKAGQVEYRVEKAGLVHAGIGKLSFSMEALKGNFMAIHSAVLAAKPNASKGVYMKKIYISSSQGPAISLDLQKMMS